MAAYPGECNDFCFAIEDESFWFEHRNRIIAAAMRRFPPGGGPLVDVGAGNGAVAAHLERSGVDVIAVEPNEEGVANMKRRGVRHAVRGRSAADAVREGGAGGIGVFDVIEHIPDEGQFLRSMQPWLAAGGRLYVTVPAYQWLWSDNDVRAGHQRRYTLRTLRRVLQSAGFAVEYATHFFTALPAPILVARTMRGRTTNECSRREHNLGRPVLRRLAVSAFSFEVACVSRGIVMPFGASCLAVATHSGMLAK